MDGFWTRIRSLLKRQDPAKAQGGCPHCALPSGPSAWPSKLDYPKEKPIRRVFIVEGCTICCACEAECPEVFKLDAEKPVSIMSAEFTPDAESYFESHRERIEAAASDCCMSVIGIEYTDGSFSPMGTRRGKVEHVVPERPGLPPLETEKD